MLLGSGLSLRVDGIYRGTVQLKNARLDNGNCHSASKAHMSLEEDLAFARTSGDVWCGGRTF